MADDERARFASFASSNSGDSDMMEYLVGLAEEERSQYAECPERADARAANNGDDATSMLPRLSMSTDGGSGVWHPNSAGNLVGGHDDDDDNDDDDGEALYSITPPPPDRRALGAQAAREGRSIRSENGDVVLRSITLRELDEADDDYENRDNDDDVDASPAQGARDDAMHANGIGDGGEGGGGKGGGGDDGGGGAKMVAAAVREVVVVAGEDGGGEGGGSENNSRGGGADGKRGWRRRRARQGRWWEGWQARACQAPTT